MFTAFWWYVGIFGTVLEIADFQKFGFFGNRSFFPRCLRFQGFWDPMVCIYNIILLCVYIYICTCRTCIYIYMYVYILYIYMCVSGAVRPWTIPSWTPSNELSCCFLAPGELVSSGRLKVMALSINVYPQHDGYLTNKHGGTNMGFNGSLFMVT